MLYDVLYGIIAYMRWLNVKVYHDHVWLSSLRLGTDLGTARDCLKAIESHLLTSKQQLFGGYLGCSLPSEFLNEVQVDASKILLAKHRSETVRAHVVWRLQDVASLGSFLVIILRHNEVVLLAVLALSKGITCNR